MSQLFSGSYRYVAILFIVDKQTRRVNRWRVKPGRELIEHVVTQTPFHHRQHARADSLGKRKPVHITRDDPVAVARGANQDDAARPQLLTHRVRRYHAAKRMRHERLRGAVTLSECAKHGVALKQITRAPAGFAMPGKIKRNHSETTVGQRFGEGRHLRAAPAPAVHKQHKRIGLMPPLVHPNLAATDEFKCTFGVAQPRLLAWWNRKSPRHPPDMQGQPRRD